ncbi:hypothetical protein D3C73_1337880 [compost metagenome]
MGRIEHSRKRRLHKLGAKQTFAGRISGFALAIAVIIGDVPLQHLPVKGGAADYGSVILLPRYTSEESLLRENFPLHPCCNFPRIQ